MSRACDRAARVAAGALALAVTLAAPAAAQTPDSIRYAVRITTVNRLGLTISNYGFFGNNFTSRSPSFEFPLGSALEHMSRGGLWVGATAIGDTGLFLGVSSAIVDNVQGSSAQAETEFTPAGTGIAVSSRILNSRYYSPDAVSDEDLVCSYSDQPARPPSGNQAERHTPISILVEQRVLGFSLPAADAIQFVRFIIRNQGPPLRGMAVGLYAQLVSGNKGAYPTWPPSGASGPGSWYYQTYVDYDSTRRLYREHFCSSPPLPEGCNVHLVPPWAGVKLLSVTPGPVDDRRVGFHWWPFIVGDNTRDEDRERYALLTDGRRMDTRPCVPGQSCSPIGLVSVGPLPDVLPGDSVVVDFAFVAGEDEESFMRNADFAQFAADIGYDLPAPPPSPRLLVEAAANAVDLYWDDSPEQARDPTSPAPDQKDFEGYRLYLGLDRQSPNRVAQFDLVDSVGFNTGLDAVRLATPRVVDGVTYRYRYRVGSLKDGFSYYGGVTSYDIGDDRVASLESGLSQNKFQVVPMPRAEERSQVVVFPNPYRVEARWDQGAPVRDHYLWFAGLPERAVLSVFTLSGDRVFQTRFDGAAYRGQSARGLYDPRQDLDTPPPVLPGSSFAWNLITDQGQAIATGLYLYAVEDLDSGRVQRGKFLVVKSDID